MAETRTRSGVSSAGSAYARVRGIARGGMGEIELALRSDGTFRRLYAIKRLHSLLRQDASFRTMFLDEARVAGLIRHPNVVSVLDVGEDERGPFLVMEFIEGISLSNFIRRLGEIGELMPVQLLLRVIADAARGLHAAHELKTPEGAPLDLIHRDVSPQNILVGYDGTVRVTDFGVAKALGSLTRTDSGLLKGKVGYMSPEQLRFQCLDRRSDLFSLGVVFYELSTGHRLYGPSDSIPAPRRILEESPPDPGERRSDLPPEVVALMFELLAKDPALRPATARDVADRLDAIRVRLEAHAGTLHLGDYLAARFGDTRRQQEAAIAEGIRQIEARGDPSMEVQLDGDPPEDDMTDATAAAKPRPQRWRLAVVISVCLFAMLAGGGAALLSDGVATDLDQAPDEDDPPGESVQARTDEEADAPEPHEPDPASATGAHGEEAELPREAATTGEPTGTPETIQDTSSHRRARSRHGSRREPRPEVPADSDAMDARDTSGQRSGVRLWDWAGP